MCVGGGSLSYVEFVFLVKTGKRNWVEVIFEEMQACNFLKQYYQKAS